MNRSAHKFKRRFLAAILVATFLPLQSAWALRATQEGAGLEELRSNLARRWGAAGAVGLAAAVALGVYMQAPNVHVQTATGELISGRKPLATVLAQVSPDLAARILTRTLQARILSTEYRGPSGKELVDALLTMNPAALAAYLLDPSKPVASRMEVIQNLATALKTQSYPVLEDALLRLMRDTQNGIEMRRAVFRVLYHAAWDNRGPCIQLVCQDPALLRAILSDDQPSEDSLAVALASAQNPDRQVRRLAAARMRRAWISGSVHPGIYSATLRLSRDSAIDSRTRRFLRTMASACDNAVPTRVKLYSYPSITDPSGYAVMAGRIHLGIIWYDEAAQTVVFGNLLGSLGPRKFLPYPLDGSVSTSQIREEIKIEVERTVSAYRLAGVDVPDFKQRAWTVSCQNHTIWMIKDLRAGRGPMAQRPQRHFNYSRIVPGARISSRFGEPRPGSTTHDGVDLAAPTGTPVYAAADGVVTAVGPNEESGLRVLIDHAVSPLSGITLQTSYGHLSEVGVSVGQKVEARQLIARVGESGNASGAHVHFTATLNGNAVDPDSYAPQLFDSHRAFATENILSPKQYVGKLETYLSSAARRALRDLGRSA